MAVKPRKFQRRDPYQVGIINLPLAVARVRRYSRIDHGWCDAASLPGEAILDAIRENA